MQTIHEKRAELLRKRGLPAEVIGGKRVSVGIIYIDLDSILVDGRVEIQASAFGHILEAMDEFPPEPETLTPQWLQEVTTVCAGWIRTALDDGETLICYPEDGAELYLRCKSDRTLEVRAVARTVEPTTLTSQFLAASEAVRALVAKGWRAG